MPSETNAAPFRTNDKRVSYILATKNRATFLERTIHNVRQFITHCDELIIVDGGSTDNTTKIVNNNRDIVSCFISDKDYGEAHAMNKGMLLARGEYIKFLTDDDMIFPSCMAEVISVMERDTSIDALLCGGEHCHLEPDGTIKLDFYFRLAGDRAMAVGKPVAKTGDTAGAGLGLILRRRVIPIVGLLDTRFLCVDTEFLARLKRSQIALRYYDGKLYRHIDYPHSGVLNSQRASHDAVLTLITQGAWLFAMKSSSQAIADALGLSSHRGGNQMSRILSNVEFLRQRRCGEALVRVTAGASTIVVKMFRLIHRVTHNGRNRSLPTPGGGWPKTEPDWLHEVL